MADSNLSPTKVRHLNAMRENQIIIEEKEK